MQVTFMDVNQGDTTLAVLSDGTSILVDCNFAEDTDYEKVSAHLKRMGKSDGTTIDILFITHPHEDHIRGIGELNKRFDIRAIYESGHRLYVSDDKKSEHYIDMINVISSVKNKGGTHKKLQAYDSIQLTETGKVQVFSPSKKYLAEENPTYRDIHDQCLVFKLEEHGVSIIFTGDSSMESWRDYIVPNYSDEKPGKGNLLKSHVLHASHHGSNTFFFKDSAGDGHPYTLGIEKVTPDISIISAGLKNRYSHPDPKALNLYKKYSISPNHVYQTKHQESIYLTVAKNGDYSISTESFHSSVKNNVGSFRVSIDASPYLTTYRKNINITFTARTTNVPPGRMIGKIKWTVQNNSKRPDKHHDQYEGQYEIARTYKNSTAYTGSHLLLCEVKDNFGKLLGATTLLINVA